MKNEIRDIIIKYGADILRSPKFQETFGQTHHISSTVGDHTIGVAAEAVRICLKYGITDGGTLKNVVVASLCHDLGIIGRQVNFSSTLQCYLQHPAHSAKRYIHITGEQNSHVTDAILCHMFPLNPRIPRYKEGWILVLADKSEAIREKLGRPVVTRADRKKLMKALSAASTYRLTPKMSGL